MMKIAILFALVAAAVADPLTRLNTLSPTGRIVGGEATSIEEVPYQVSIQVLNSHVCGGSIISDTWILTAGHCMIYSTSWYSVRAGSTLITSGGTVVSAASVITHDEYGTTTIGILINDISLIKLERALKLDALRSAIPLFSAGEEAEVGAVAVITGWGNLNEGGYSATVLQTVSVPIVSKSYCDEVYTIFGGLPSGQICAAVPEGGKDSCQGDSGGPLAINGRLAGVVSWGNGCARAGYPGAYTEVAVFRDWIATNSGV